jgi:hypothetical protein
MKTVITILVGALWLLRTNGHAIAKRPDPCALLTPAEVAHALGEPIVSKPTRTQTGPMIGCTFVTTSKQNWVLDTLAACSTEAYRQLTSGGKPVSGLGDAASWDETKLVVRKGDTCLLIPPVGSAHAKTAEVLEPTKALARKALARLTAP